MSIIVLTPKPKNPTVAATLANRSIGETLASDFLHLIGQDGHRFDSFEELRSFAQAQIDAAAASTPAVIESTSAVDPNAGTGPAQA